MKIKDLELRINKSKVVGIRLPEEVYNRVREIANQEKVSIAEVCSAIIRKGVYLLED